jgi:hypothetical protein
MAPVWLIPALRAVAPHLATIVSAGMPAFSSSTAARQIEELQNAAAANAGNVKELAEQLQRTMEGVDAAARVAEQRLRMAVWLGAGALALSLAALVLAALALTAA